MQSHFALFTEPLSLHPAPSLPYSHAPAPPPLSNRLSQALSLSQAPSSLTGALSNRALSLSPVPVSVSPFSLPTSSVVLCHTRARGSIKMASTHSGNVAFAFSVAVAVVVAVAAIAVAIAVCVAICVAAAFAITDAVVVAIAFAVCRKSAHNYSLTLHRKSREIKNCQRQDK